MNTPKEQVPEALIYAALPTHSHTGRVYEEGFLIGTCPLYTADQMRVFADATHALRTQQPAPATQQAREVVPMTPEQRDALWESCKYDDGEEWTVDWEQIVDAVERHHRIGIKGGQHGTE